MPESPHAVNPALSAIAIQYANENKDYIADDVMFRVKPELLQAEYTYRVHDLATNFTIPDTAVGRKGEVAEITHGSELKPGACKDYGIKEFVPRRDQNQVRGAKMRESLLAGASKRVADQIRLDRERRVAKIVFDATNYSASRKSALTGTAKISSANSKPIQLIQDARHSLLVHPANVMVIGLAAWQKLSTHPEIVKAVHGNSGDAGIARKSAVRDLFGLDDILIGRAVYNSAKEGQTMTAEQLWGGHIQLQYRNRSASNEGGLTWGATMVHQSLKVWSRFDANYGLLGADEVKAGESVDEKIFAKDLGYLIQNAV